MHQRPRRVRLGSGEVIDAEDLPSTAVRPPPAPPVPKALSVATAPPKVTQSPQSDRELLDALASVQNRLTMTERAAFDGMRHKMHLETIQALSYGQRAWAQEVAARHGFDVEAPDNWRETAKELRKSHEQR